jgi:hypothetical protein
MDPYLFYFRSLVPGVNAAAHYFSESIDNQIHGLPSAGDNRMDQSVECVEYNISMRELGLYFSDQKVA